MQEGPVRSRLFRDALSARDDDLHAEQRERLRSSYRSFRQRAGLLANEIANDFRHLTVHDQTHLDALWEMADLAVSGDFTLNPSEAFVLGGAILLHDLGLAVAAYGPDHSLRAEAGWNDALAETLKHRLGRLPTAAELASADTEATRAAETTLMRRLHARQAQNLASASWTDDRGEKHHLIEDAELRRAFGSVIGKLAHSHWWETDRLPREFGARLGSLPGTPQEWTVEPLRLACILRVADAMHIDARRAPFFLRTLRAPNDIAAEHWAFQERLLLPQVSDGRVAFTSADAFPAAESRAWWRCFETLQDIDRWLREVDALLADLKLDRLVARAVVGVEAPERLSMLIPTAGWSPVDTHIQVSNVAALVENLGGQELYGDDNPTVPLRELIQNAADAVRARRALQADGRFEGSISVRLGEDDHGHWLEVEDNGVGMSTDVLTKGLLDFGTSYWASPELPLEFPGLLGTGFDPTGRFGIGFFSVFMLGRRVRVTTRPFRDGLKDTVELTFHDGPSERPLLSRASEAQALHDGGTRIRAWLSTPPQDEGGLLVYDSPRLPRTLAEVCTRLCPGLDVPVRVGSLDEPEFVIAGDWRTMSANELIARIQVTDPQSIAQDEILARFSEIIRPVHNDDGTLVGRLAVCPFLSARHLVAGSPTGVVATNGLYGDSLTGLMGYLVGQAESASRKSAVPIVERSALARWADEQARLVGSLDLSPQDESQCAEVLYLCGGSTSPLRIGMTDDGWKTIEEIAAWASGLDQVVIATPRSDFETSALFPGVLITTAGLLHVIRSIADVAGSSWPDFGFWDDALDDVVLPSAFSPLFFSTVAEQWGVTVAQLCRQSQLSTTESHWRYTLGVTEDGEEFTDSLVSILRRTPA